MFLRKRKINGKKLGIFGTMFAACAMSFGISSFSQDFNYTGGVQAFTAPISATYRLEAWGAQGGWVGNYGGFGGYSKGDIYLSKGTTIYVVVGGKGGCMSTIHAGGSDSPSIEWEGKPGGYNGGGKGGDESSYWRNTYNFYYEGGAGGGGATHIARANRGVLANYKNYQGEVLLVAGGGGGAGGWTRGGTGGGSINCRDEPHNQTSGGTQSSGYAFGIGGPGGPGQSVANDLAMEGRGGGGGGGGGWYGGYGGPEGENSHEPRATSLIGA